MAQCRVCGKPPWVYKDMFSSCYCEDCRIQDVAESYVENLAVVMLAKEI